MRRGAGIRQQEKREQLRLEAVGWLERGDEATVIAADLR
jgi:hypothetical protein